jgi:hypothetical protein
MSNPETPKLCSDPLSCIYWPPSVPIHTPIVSLAIKQPKRSKRNAQTFKENLGISSLHIEFWKKCQEEKKKNLGGFWAILSI